MAIKYAIVGENGETNLHHNAAEEVNELPHREAIKLTDAEYEQLALGKATLVKGKVKPI